MVEYNEVMMKTLENQKLLFTVAAAKNKQAKPEKKEAYKVSFFEASKAQAWSTKLQMIPSPNEPKIAIDVVDIYSLNLDLSASKTEPFITPKEAKKIAKELTKIPQIYTHKNENKENQVLFVADIKIKEFGYTNPGIILEKEKELLNQFIIKEKPKYIQQLIDLGVTYIFMEGSLKADLIGNNIFSDSDKEHLKNTSVDFCQLVEFMINTFKRGERVILKNKETGKSQVFSAETYIKKTGDQVPDFHPSNLSYTIYPAQYESIAMQGSYTKAMQQSGLFKITTKPDTDSKIVEMKTEKMIGGSYV